MLPDLQFFLLRLKIENGILVFQPTDSYNVDTLPLNFLVAALILTHAFAAIPSPIDPCTLFDLIARSSAVWLSVLHAMYEHFSVVCIQVLVFFRDALTACREHFLIAVASYSIPKRE